MIMTEVEKLNEKCNKLKALVIREKKVNVENAKTISELSGKYEQSRKENDQLASQLQRLSLSIGELQNSQETDIHAIERKYLEEMESLKQELKERDTDFEEAMKSNKHELETVADKLSEYSGLLEKEQQMRQALEAEKSSLTAELEEKDGVIAALQMAKSELGLALKDLDERMRRNSEELTVKLEESKLVIRDLEQRAIDAAASNSDSSSSLELTIRALEQERAKDNSCIESLRGSISEMKEQLAAQQRESDEIKAESEIKLREAEQSIYVLRQEMEKIQSDAQTQIEAKDTIISDLKVSLSAGAPNEAMMEKLASREVDMDRIQAELCESQKENARNQDQVSDLEAKLMTSSEQCAQLQQKVLTLSQTADAAESNFEVVLQEKTNVIEALEGRLSEEKSKDALIEKLTAQLQATETELAVTSSEGGEAVVSEVNSQEIEEMKQRISSLTEDKHLLKDELDTLKESSDAGQNLIRNLCSSLDLKVEADEEIVSKIISAVHAMKVKVELTDTESSIESPNDGEALSKIHSVLQSWSSADGHLQDCALGNDEDLTLGSFQFGPLLTSVHGKLVHGEMIDASHAVLQDGMVQMSRKCGELEEAMDEKDKQLRLVNTKLTENAEAMDELETDIASRDEQVEQLQTMVEDTRNIVRALEREKDALQSEIMELTTRSEEKEALLTEEIRELRTLVSAKEDSIHKMQMSSDTLKDTESALSTHLSMTESRCQELEEAMKKQSNEICCLESDNSAMRSELEVSNQEKETTFQMLTDERKAKQEVEKHLIELSTKLETTQTALAAFEAELQTKQEEMAMQVAECDRLRSSLREAEEKLMEQEALDRGMSEEVKAHASQLESATSLLQENEEKVQALTLENDSLRAKVQEVEATASELQKIVAQKSEQMQELGLEKESIVSQIAADNESLKQRIAEFESSTSQLHETLSQKSEEIIQLYEVTSQNEDLKKEKSRLDLLTSQLREELALKVQLVEDTNAEMEARLADQSSEKMSLSQRTSELEALVSEQHEELAQKAELIKDRDRSVTELRSENEIFERKASELESMLSSVREELAEKSKLIDETASERDVRLTEVISENSSLKQQLAELETLTSDVREELAQKAILCQKIAAKNDSQSAQLKGENENLKQQNAHFESTTVQLREEVNRLSAIIDENNVERGQCLSEREKLVHRINNLETSASSYTDEINDKTEQLKETNAERDQIISERNDLSQRVAELQDEVARKSEIVVESLQQKADDAKENETLKLQIASLQSELEQLKQETAQQAETSEKMTKMKGLVLKLKRELAEAAKSHDEANGRLSSLEQESATERAQFEQALATLRETLEAEAGALRAQIIAMEQEIAVQRNQSQQLMSERLEAEEKLVAERAAATADVQALKEELTARDLRLEELQAGLTRAERDGRQRSVMDLELAEFERAVESLKDQLDAANERLQNSTEEMEAKEACVTSLQSQIRETDAQRTQAEERANKLKQMLVKTKRELAESKRKEEELRSHSAGLSTETESITGRLEACKLELAAASAEKLAAEERVTQLRSRLATAQKSQDATVTDLKAQVRLLEEEKKELSSEYAAYKAKAQAAFRRERPSGLASSSLVMEEPAVTAVRQRLEEAIERLKDRKEEVEARLEATLTERDVLQRDFDRLQERFRKMEADFRLKEAHWDQRLARLSKENNISEGEHLSALHQLTEENEALIRNHREQLREREEEYVSQAGSLQAQIDMAETENERLQVQLQQLQHQLEQQQQQQQQQQQHHLQQQQLLMLKEQRLEHLNRPPVGDPASPDLWSPSLDGPEGPHAFSTPRSIGQRMQAEGMEYPTEAVHGNGKTSPTRQSSYVSFEQLIAQSVPSTGAAAAATTIPGASEGPPDHSDAVSITSAATAQTDATVESLRQEVSRMERRSDHLSELLSDSESMVQHLTEQANVLKAEIRRHELNTAREHHVESNAEYLKNVVMKFITLTATDERQRLVPVMATVLSLTKEEKNMLMRVAELGSFGNVDANQSGQGWSSYFHWSSLT